MMLVSAGLVELFRSEQEDLADNLEQFLKVLIIVYLELYS